MSAAEQMPDNVVYIASWKMKKQMESMHYVPYKNTYYFMSPEERTVEREKVAAQLAENPLNYMANMKKRAQEETDNG